MAGTEIIKKYFPDISSDTIEMFEKMFDLYMFWNQQINVISRKDTDSFYERHVLHSLAIARFIRFAPGERVMDVGTGGGFPGIPLAVMFPETEFLLVDSIGKKIKVVNAVAESLGLKNVSGMHIRAEDAAGHFDFITSRAVAPMKELYGWAGKKIIKTGRTPENGMLWLKGGDLTAEIMEFRSAFPGKKTELHAIKNWFDEEFFETKYLVHVS